MRTARPSLNTACSCSSSRCCASSPSRRSVRRWPTDSIQRTRCSREEDGRSRSLYSYGCRTPQHEDSLFPYQELVMKRLTAIARNFVAQEDGAALLEYGMLVLLIAVLCIVAVKTIGSKISNGFNSVNANLP